MNGLMPVNHEYLYPNILAVREYVENLVRFCDGAYRAFMNKVIEEEKKNEPLKYEHREYKYKKSYGTWMKIYISTNNSVSLEYDDDGAFRTAVNNGKLNNVSSLNIELNLDFGKGKEGSIEDHKNEFRIEFRPYNIKFVRNSNYTDPEMDELEKQIVKLMEDFPATKTIFTPE